MPFKCRTGFTLVELLIVIIILGVLVAVVVPYKTNTSLEFREGELKTNLSMLQQAVELYKVEHNNSLPGSLNGVSNWAIFVKQLTARSDASGHPGKEFGPYLRYDIPANPFNRLNDGIIGPIPEHADDNSGWYYCPQTGEIRANVSGRAMSGKPYLELK